MCVRCEPLLCPAFHPCSPQRELFPIVYGDEFYNSLLLPDAYSLVVVSTADDKVRGLSGHA